MSMFNALGLVFKHRGTPRGTPAAYLAIAHAWSASMFTHRINHVYQSCVYLFTMVICTIYILRVY